MRRGRFFATVAACALVSDYGGAWAQESSSTPDSRPRGAGDARVGPLTAGQLVIGQGGPRLGVGPAPNPTQFGTTSGPTLQFGTGAPTNTGAAAGSVYVQKDTATIWVSFGPGSTPADVQHAGAHGTYAVTMGATPTSGDLLVGICWSGTTAPSANTGWTSEGTGGYTAAPVSDVTVVGRIVSGDTTAETPCTGSGPGSVEVFEISGAASSLASAFQSVSITGVYRGTSARSTNTTAANTFAIGGGAVGGNTNGCPITLSGTVAPAVVTDATCTPGAKVGEALVVTSGSTATMNAAGAGGTGSWSTAGVLILISPNANPLTTGWQRLPPLSGASPTPTGTCPVNTQVGGNTVGTFKANGACAAGTVILTFSFTAPHGYACNAHDRTTTADAMNETSDSTNSATLTGNMANLDVVSFDCWPY